MLTVVKTDVSVFSGGKMSSSPVADILDDVVNELLDLLVGIDPLDGFIDGINDGRIMSSAELGAYIRLGKAGHLS